MDEVVAMDPAKLKFAKRKLRVTRCKASGDKHSRPTGDNSSHSAKKNVRNVATSPDKNTSPKKNEHSSTPKIKGDPKLGEKLRGMSKEERREAKKQDANRIARRMEKKRNRLSLEKGLKRPEKGRIRVRKATAVRTAKNKPIKQGPA